MRIRLFQLDIVFPILSMLAIVVAASDTRSASRATPGDDDREAEKLLAEGKADARDWLKHEKHAVWKWDRADALKAVEELHAAGAKNVWVVGITREADGAELAAQFVTALPVDTAARKRVFAWIAKWEKRVEIDGEDRTTDVGQKFFVLSTDL